MEDIDKFKLSRFFAGTVFCFILIGGTLFVGKLGCVAASTILLISRQVEPSFRWAFRVIWSICSFSFIFSALVSFWSFSKRSLSDFNRTFWACRRFSLSRSSRSRAAESVLRSSKSLRRIEPDLSTSRWRANKHNYDFDRFFLLYFVIKCVGAKS